MNKNYWMFNCREIASLVSQSMDKELTFTQRLGISLHLMMCSMCTTNRKQLLQLRGLLRNERFPQSPLSDDAKKRIKDLLTSQPSGE